MKDHTLKARARLTWLAEKAFGLESVKLSPTENATAAAESAPAAPGAGVVRPSAEQPPVSRSPAAPATARNVGLFGPTDRSPSSKLPPPLAAAHPPSAITGPALSGEQKRLALQQLDEGSVRNCTRCGLSQGRTQTVFGEGDVDAQIMFIGEGPGENEDLQGRPFVGRAGELLNKMIAGMGLRREQVYICNIVKCRPPGNRAPVPDEVAACAGFLERQIETIRPKVIVTLGAPAAKHILRDDKISITRLRGQWREYRGIKVMPTFHPAFILRQYTEQVRRQVWSDLQAVMAEVGLPRAKNTRENA